MYIVYMDILILKMLFMNLVVLVLAAEFLRCFTVKLFLRGILAAVLSTLTQCIFLLTIRNYIFYVLSTFFVSIALATGIVFSFRQIRRFVRSYIIVVGITIFFGGFLSAIRNVFQLESLSVLVVILAMNLTIYGIIHLYKTIRIENTILLITIRNGPWTIKEYALYDSGNRLREPYKKKAVHIIGKDIFYQLHMEYLRPIGFVPFQTVGNKNGIIEIYNIDQIQIEKEGRIYCYNNIIIGYAKDNPFHKKKYKMILNADTFIERSSNVITKNKSNFMFSTIRER